MNQRFIFHDLMSDFLPFFTKIHSGYFGLEVSFCTANFEYGVACQKYIFEPWYPLNNGNWEDIDIDIECFNPILLFVNPTNYLSLPPP